MDILKVFLEQLGTGVIRDHCSTMIKICSKLTGDSFAIKVGILAMLKGLM